MYFDSFKELLAMGGHGFYVWLAYAVCLLVLFLLVLSSRWRARRQRRQLQQFRRLGSGANSTEPG